MNRASIIDVRGMEHDRREERLFPALEELVEGEELRIVLEFDPIPPIHMLGARGDLELSKEKRGSEEWVLKVKRTNNGHRRKSQFKKLLRELKSEDPIPEIRDEAKELLQSVDAETLGVIEQELIREGVSHEDIRGSLCDIHLDMMRDSLVSKKREVPPPHPVNTLMEEHKVILESLDDLGEVVERIGKAEDFGDIEEDLTRLKDISHHLVEAESHHQREEDCLFPVLERHDVTEPPNIMRMDHEELRARKKELYQYAHAPEDHDFSEFRHKVMELGEYLTRELESHIFKEDNILYQIALEILDDEEWEEVKRKCDAIGYCCFSPEDRE